MPRRPMPLRRAVAMTIVAAGLLCPIPCLRPLLAANDPDALTVGKAALEDGLYAVAEKHFETCLKDAEDGKYSAEQAEQALVYLVRTLYEQKKYSQIQDFLASHKRWIRKTADSGILPFWRGVVSYELGNADAALSEIRDFETRYTNSEYVASVNRLRAWCQLKKGNFDEALAEFAKFDAAGTNAAVVSENRLEWAKALESSGRLEDARRMLVTVAAADPGMPATLDGRYWLGQVLLKEGRSGEALPVLLSLATNAAANDDLRAESWLCAAVAYQAETNVFEATAALNTGIEQARSPDLKRKGKRSLGLLLLGSGQVEDGAVLLKEFVAASPDDPLAAETQMALADALLDQGRYADATVEYQHYLEAFTNLTGQARAHQGMGWGLMNVGRYAEAASAFFKAYGEHDVPAEKERCLFKVGDAYFANSQYKLAAENYELLIAGFPDSPLKPDALLQLGESRVRAGDPEGALQAFDAAEKSLPGSPQAEKAMFRIAEIKAAAGRWQQAIDDFNAVIGTYSNGAYAGEALLDRAKASYRLLKYADALRDFETLVSGSPTNALAEEACYWTGMCYYYMGQEDKALSIAGDFVNRYPDSVWAPLAMFWTGEYEYNRGNYENAENRFLMFVRRFPADPKAADSLLWAGRAAAMRTEYLQAIEILTRLVKEYPNSARVAEARFAQGDALCNLAKFPEAILVFQEILNKYPASGLVPRTWMRKGDGEFMLGSQDPKRYEEAIRSYGAVVNSAEAGLDLVLQAQYKIGRCLEKAGRIDEAVSQYYAKVVIRFLEDREKRVPLNETAKMWFTRACFNLADIFEAKKEWRQVVSILQRVQAAGIPVTDVTRNRIKRIRSEHWWLFY